MNVTNSLHVIHCQGSSQPMNDVYAQVFQVHTAATQ